jgi:hypothetical protein
MILILNKKASEKEIKEVAEHFKGYVKVVVDIQQNILAAGGDRHSDEEKLLLESGSKQQDLWGGGIDMETKTIDYDSVINLRPNEDNPNRVILSVEIREKFDKIIKEILL